jgi:hypothetical protein
MIVRIAREAIRSSYFGLLADGSILAEFFPPSRKLVTLGQSKQVTNGEKGCTLVTPACLDCHCEDMLDQLWYRAVGSVLSQRLHGGRWGLLAVGGGAAGDARVATQALPAFG